MDGDTIAAIATPVGAGGIGVIKISGPDSKSIAEAIFVPTKKCRTSSRVEISEGKKLGIRKLQYGHIVDSKTERIIDEVLVVYMPAPHSYTKEDVVEIQTHAGTIPLRAVLTLVLKCGARVATPGEFTRRAFLNGRIDLSQAEAVMEIIHARSDRSLIIATSQLKGAISEVVQRVVDALEDVHAILEVAIDFNEDVEDSFDPVSLVKKVEKEILCPMRSLLESYDNKHFIREGLRLVILGRPNVGKSSLLNRFLEKERAIVTEYPGTTRDSLEEALNISGLPVIIVDTAGWHDTADPVEKLGIKRAKDLVAEADLILFLIGADTGVGSDDCDIYEYIQKKDAILVVNKRDLIKNKKSGSIPENWKFHDTICISAKFDQGIDELKKCIFKFAVKNEGFQESEIVPNIRQQTILSAAKGSADAGLVGLKENISPELIAIDIKDAINNLKDIMGDNIKRDVLENIFSRFCIGK